MINNSFKKKKTTFSKDYLTNYNIVNVCKHTIVNDDKTLQIYNEGDLQG